MTRYTRLVIGVAIGAATLLASALAFAQSGNSGGPPVSRRIEPMHRPAPGPIYRPAPPVYRPAPYVHRRQPPIYRPSLNLPAAASGVSPPGLSSAAAHLQAAAGLSAARLPSGALLSGLSRRTPDDMAGLSRRTGLWLRLEKAQGVDSPWPAHQVASHMLLR